MVLLNIQHEGTTIIIVVLRKGVVIGYDSRVTRDEGRRIGNFFLFPSPSPSIILFVFVFVFFTGFRVYQLHLNLLVGIINLSEI